MITKYKLIGRYKNFDDDLITEKTEINKNVLKINLNGRTSQQFVFNQY